MSARAHRAVSASLAPLLVLLLLLQAAPARGAVYHVADEPGLLAAVTAANAAADADIIYVTGNITVTAQLPALAPPLTIDGSQAPGGRGALTGPGGAFTLFGGAPAGVALTDLLIRGAALGAAGGTLTRLELDGGGFATAGPAILGSGNALNPLTLSDVVIRGYDGGASPTSYGGALLVQYSAVVTAVRCSFENNKAEYGGAVAVSNFATFSCAECTCAGNAADVIPGAAGGCLYGALSSNVTMSRCTISGNRATAGGGVYARGALALRQSTLSGNAASGSAGGVTVDGGQLARALLSSCTVTGHTSTTGATAFAIGGGVPFEIVNSIIQCQAPCVAFLGASTVTVSHSIIPAGWEGYGGAGNLAAPPLLGPLQDNGGPTRTHALLAGSPAVNAGDASKLDASDASDQRGPGFPRVAAGGLDMGALEMQPPTVSQLSLRTFKNTVLVASLLPAVKAGDSAVASIASLAAQGAAGGRVAVAPATGSLTYTPAFKFVNGNDTFTLEATGADALKAAGTITVTVEAGLPPAPLPALTGAQLSLLSCTKARLDAINVTAGVLSMVKNAAGAIVSLGAPAGLDLEIMAASASTAPPACALKLKAIKAGGASQRYAFASWAPAIKCLKAMGYSCAGAAPLKLRVRARGGKGAGAASGWSPEFPFTPICEAAALGCSWPA